MLEENIREVEIRSEERLETERKRNRDALQRVEREKQLEIENYSIRLQTLEKEYGKLEAEAAQLRAQSDRLRQEKAELEDQVSHLLQMAKISETKIVYSIWHSFSCPSHGMIQGISFKDHTNDGSF